MQAAVPAPKNLTAAEGTKSLGFMPAIATPELMTQMEKSALNALCPGLLCTIYSTTHTKEDHYSTQNITSNFIFP